MNFLSTYLPSPIIFNWGPISLHWYGLLLSVGVLLGYGVSKRLWREHGGAAGKFDNLLLWLLLSGFIGARLIDVFMFEWWYFKDNLFEIWKIWQGGLAFHGALLGGAAALWLWCKHNKHTWLELADVLAPALALGQAIGRWGNYFNQELFGLPTTLPWGIPIALSYRPAVYSVFTYFHPVFLYESLGLLILALVIWKLRKHNWPKGRLFSLYLITSGVLRLALEFLRIDDQSQILGVRAGLLVAFMVVIIGLVIWRWSVKKVSITTLS
jgi:phosphatidylglycerol:prolipoprotein diacylglycerol transferase